MKVSAAAIALVAVAACGPRAGSPGSTAPAIQLTEAAPGARVVDVVGLPRDDLDALDGTSADEWPSILLVTVDGQPEGGGVPPMSGSYAIVGDRVRFTPDFPLDPRVGYRVVFKLPGGAPLEHAIAASADQKTSTTRVTEVYPADTLFENHLRLYVHFSAPMSTRRARAHFRLLDDRGDVVEAFLPLDVSLWNDDRTRITLLFDPGRVKRGILPNLEMGRPLEQGRRYTLVVDREWPDAAGLPLVETFKREFRVVGAALEAIDPVRWRLAPPAAATRAPFTVTFASPLDHALALRTIWVETSGGRSIEGDVAVDAATTRWSFTPAEPWEAGDYRLRATSDLEDPAGNRIGRPFDYDAALQGEDGRYKRTEASLPFMVTRR